MSNLIPTEVAETTTETTQTVEASPQTETTEQTEQTTTENNANYLFADGVLGEGEVPEWFKSEKYKTVSDQAKAYTDLESKFGSFTGAPKEGIYEIEGIDFENDPLFKEVGNWGLERELSQEGLHELVMRIGKLGTERQAAQLAEAKEQLGTNADSRLNNLATWAKNNLEAEEYATFQGLAQTAADVIVLEKIIGMSKNSKLVDNKNIQTQQNSNLTEEQLKKEYLAVNDKGQRLMDIDADYNKRVMKKYKEFYGE